MRYPVIISLRLNAKKAKAINEMSADNDNASKTNTYAMENGVTKRTASKNRKVPPHGVHDSQLT